MRTELYVVEGPWPGRLAIVPRPRGGDWLEEEVRAWRTAGVAVVVSALEPDEAEELDLTAEAETCRVQGIEWIAFPIPDRGVPNSLRQTSALVCQVETLLNQGKTVAIHCRQGVGRSGLLAASVLASAGVNPVVAFKRISEARGCAVPDTTEQCEWVARLAREMEARQLPK